ncbi:hypothetical protein G4228_013835 [Cervus hanglu yarkandensis]|nr:hypothetical protein G4228_013835 [Cervus hanglu yarkandensis]
MYSRAYILLKREFKELKNNNYEVMLSNPVLENPVNLEAAHILMKDETLYRLIILRLFHQPLPFLKDPNFIKQYYNWKKDDLRHTKEWSLR